MNTFWITMNKVIWTTFLISIVAATLTEARRCYVCGFGADEPFRTTRYHDLDGGNGKRMGSNTNVSAHNLISIPPTCDDFDGSNSLEKFEFECPLSYVGCLTQVEGNQIIRTCDILQINDCKTANSVKYCYCNSNLCNGKYTPSTTSQPMDIIDERKAFMSDDEDLMEASGSKEITPFDSLDTLGPMILHTETETSEQSDSTVEQTIPWTPPAVTTARNIYLTTTEEPRKLPNSHGDVFRLSNLLLLGIFLNCLTRFLN